jgi:hypothetical protein
MNQSDRNLLLGQSSSIFIDDSNLLHLLELVHLNCLKLENLVSLTHSHFPAFFQEVQSLLLLYGRVLGDLSSQILLVVRESATLLIGDYTVFLLVGFLLSDDSHELLSFKISKSC